MRLMMKVTAAAAAACIVLLLAQPMELQGAPGNSYTHETAKSKHWVEDEVPTPVYLLSKVEGTGSDAYINAALWHPARIDALHAAIQQEGISFINCDSQGDSFKTLLEQLLSGIPTDQYGIHVTCRDPCTTVIIAFPAGVVTVNFDVCTRKFI